MATSNNHPPNMATTTLPTIHPVYQNARTEKLASAEKRLKLGLNHFDFFMQGYSLQKGFPYTSAKDLPYCGIPPQPNEKAIFKWWSDLVGAFMTYLMSYATKARKPGAQRISKGSAEQYSSDVRKYFCGPEKFELDKPIPVFHGAQWADLMRKLQGRFREHHRATNTKVVESIEGSTREDRECLAIGCIWDGCASSAEFWHLQNASYHCAARGSEVSLASPEDHSVHEVNESVYEYQVLHLELQKQKLGGDLQDIALYPFRDNLYECYYFSAIYLVVMVGCNHEYVFPNFSRAALATTKTGKSASKVSALWKSLLEDLRTKFDSLSDKINKNLSSHCNKKGSNQVMANSSNVSGPAQVFRTYGSRGRDSIWEYFNDAPVLSQQCGKALSKWSAKIGDTVVGGQPCTFQDIGTRRNIPQPRSPVSSQSSDSDNDVATGPITGDRAKLLRFTEVLFADDRDRRWNDKVRELLVMALLLRYNQFCTVLRSQPGAMIRECTFKTYSPNRHDIDRSYDYDTIQDNLFICKVKEALLQAEVDICTFNNWCEQTCHAFIERNVAGLPSSAIDLYGGNGKTVMMDVRCFAEHFAALSSTTQATHVAVQQLRHQMSDIIDILRYDRVDSNELYSISNSIKRLEDHILGEEDSGPATQSPSIPVKKFSVSSKALTKHASVVDATVLFFVEDFPVGMSIEQRSDSWKDLEPKEQRSMRNRFSAIKRAVRMVVYHMPSFPPPADRDFKSTLRNLTIEAVKRLRQSYSLPEDKNITVHTIASNSQTTPLELALKLPSDLPEVWRKALDKN